MDARYIDFNYLITQVFLNFGTSYADIRERYKGFPVCLMEYINKDERSEHIKVKFDKGGAWITYVFDREWMLLSTYISFWKDSYLGSYIEKHAKSCSGENKRWLIADSFYLVMDESSTGTDFHCFKQ